MSYHLKYRNYAFWALVALTFTLIGLGFILTWTQGQMWLHTLWYLCQQQIENVGFIWSLIVPTLLMIIILRASLSATHQIRATLQLKRTFYRLRETPPLRLKEVIKTNHLQENQVVFLHLSTPHAFCLGFWKPRIWLTSGLVELLTNEELAAVLAHEAHHCRQRDPLRLVISRMLKSAFFFLPIVHDLVRAAELQQEIDADQAAIAQLGNDLPLLCALQKLLQQGTVNIVSNVAYSPFNITEARLRRLIAVPSPTKERVYLSKWSINLAVMAILAIIALPAAGSALAQDEIVSCTSDYANHLNLSAATWLDYNR